MGPEAKVEAYLVKRCRELSWLCEKYTSPNKRAVPDRIIFMPFNRVVFVELKAPEKKPTKLQEYDHKKRREMGFTVYVCDSKEAVDKMIQEEI